MKQYDLHGEWIEIPKKDLLPPAYRRSVSGEYLYVFNPSICQYKGELYMAYRIAKGDDMRKMALCKIGAAFDVIPGSVMLLSETIDDEGYHADPRLFTINNHLFIIYNNDKSRPQNMYLLEIDPQTLHAKGTPRMLTLYGMERRTIEKNWMPFEYGNEMYMVYSIDPFVIIRADLSKEVGAIPCMKIETCNWNTGMMRQTHGACPPLMIGDMFISFTNIVRFSPTYNHTAWKRRPFRALLLFYQKKYSAGVYTFQKQQFFCPQKILRCIFTPKFVKKPVSPHDVRTPGHSQYIAGATIDQKTGDVIVSCGINNDACVLYRVKTDLKDVFTKK